MSPSNAFVCWRTYRQNFNNLPVQDHSWLTKTVCVWCHPLQPASKLQHWYWRYWCTVQIFGDTVRVTRSWKWTGIIALLLQRHKHHFKNNELRFSTMFGNDVQLWLYKRRRQQQQLDGEVWRHLETESRQDKTVLSCPCRRCEQALRLLYCGSAADCYQIHNCLHIYFTDYVRHCWQNRHPCLFLYVRKIEEKFFNEVFALLGIRYSLNG